MYRRILTAEGIYTGSASAQKAQTKLDRKTQRAGSTNNCLCVDPDDNTVRIVISSVDFVELQTTNLRSLLQAIRDAECRVLRCAYGMEKSFGNTNHVSILAQCALPEHFANAGEAIQAIAQHVRLTSGYLSVSQTENSEDIMQRAGEAECPDRPTVEIAYRSDAIFTETTDELADTIVSDFRKALTKNGFVIDEQHFEASQEEAPSR